MDKPITRIRSGFYIWSEVVDYIEAKHGCDIRDFGGWKKDRLKPYLDYWHFIIDACSITNNGCYFTIDDGTLEYAKEDWQKEITGWILDEFGSATDWAEKEVEFWVEW